MYPVNFTDSVEALDAQMRPLCILSRAAIAEQKLLHRAVAIIAHNGRGELMLRMGEEADFTCIALLPAGMTASRYVLDLRASVTALNGRLRHLASLVPQAGTANAALEIHETIYSGAKRKFPLGPEFALVPISSVLTQSFPLAPCLAIFLQAAPHMPCFQPYFTNWLPGKVF